MSNLPLEKNSFKNDIIIGFFDVLHKGHLQLFKQYPQATVLTFDNIPRKTNVINDLQTRIKNLHDIGVQNIIVMNLLSINMSAQTFIDQYLKYAQRIIVGSDFIFGNDQQPIQKFANQLNLMIIDYDKSYSTSKIKELLLNGDIQSTNQLLIKPFTLTKIVQHGNHMGRVLGFPTINFYFSSGGFLHSGVYLTKTYIKHQIYKSLSVAIKQKNIDGKLIDTLETHILDFNGDLYNQKISVEFIKKMGDLKQAKNLDELKQIIQSYVDQVKHYQ